MPSRHDTDAPVHGTSTASPRNCGIPSASGTLIIGGEHVAHGGKIKLDRTLRAGCRALIRLLKPRIRNLLEAMPVKCRVETESEALGASASEERYFYRAVTPAAFSSMMRRVAYVEVTEWARAKHALRRIRRRERVSGRKLPTSWKTMTRRLREGDSSFVKVYFQLSHLAETDNPDGVVTVSESEALQCSDVLLVPPTTTDRDIRTIIEPLASMPQFQASQKRMASIVRQEQSLENHKSGLDKCMTDHLAALIARALEKPVHARAVLDAHQPLPEPITLPAVLNTRSGEGAQATTIDRVFFKAVPAYGLEKLLKGEVKYVLTDNWLGGHAPSVQMYSRVSAGVRRARGFAQGTVDTAGEGHVQRDHLMLVEPRTTPPMLRRIIENIQASDHLLRICLRAIGRIDVEIRKGWMEAAEIMKKDKHLQMRLLLEAFPPTAWTSTE